MAVCAFGATMASLNQDIVKLINVPVPPIDIQNKIVGLLSAYDDRETRMCFDGHSRFRHHVAIVRRTTWTAGVPPFHFRRNGTLASAQQFST